jgi:hypothetical protein
MVVDDVIDDFNPEEGIKSIEYAIVVLENFLEHLKTRAKDR